MRVEQYLTLTSYVGLSVDFFMLSWYFKLDSILFVTCIFLLQLWVAIVAASFSTVLLHKAIILSLIPANLSTIVYSMIQVTLYVSTPQLVRYFEYGPGMTSMILIILNFCNLSATSAFIMCETVRLSMKMHSYYLVNNMLRYAKLNQVNDPSVAEYPSNVTFLNYFQVASMI